MSELKTHAERKRELEALDREKEAWIQTCHWSEFTEENLAQWEAKKDRVRRDMAADVSMAWLEMTEAE